MQLTSVPKNRRPGLQILTNHPCQNSAGEKLSIPAGGISGDGGTNADSWVFRYAANDKVI
jgi:hypothetical protein